jgi:membrane-bound lytic murein transglycosylase D
MRCWGQGIRLTLLLGLVLGLSHCATSPEFTPASLPKKEIPQGLIPPDYLCSSKPDQALDPRLAQEIEKFLEDSGILQNAPEAGKLPTVLNAPVQAYLRHFSTTQKAVFKSYLSRSGRYLPLMRRIFQEHGFPQDLVYLALVESGFNPWARSPAEAIGPWQFVEGTARRYNLKIDDRVDERRDPEKSTRAAARYLKDLYHQFGCWYLAAAAYNAGENRVDRAVRRNQAPDFWSLAQKGLLPRETCQYVPQFIAAALIAKEPERYGFCNIIYEKPFEYQKVKLPGGTDLKAFAQELAISWDVLRELNPELQTEMAPQGDKGYLLRVPKSQAQAAGRMARRCWQDKQ